MTLEIKCDIQHVDPLGKLEPIDIWKTSPREVYLYGKRASRFIEKAILEKLDRESNIDGMTFSEFMDAWLNGRHVLVEEER